MTAAEWIAERRELLAAATEGPWDCYRPHPNYRTYQVSSVAPGGYLDDEVANCDDVRAAENAALIADARTSLPRALDALEAALEDFPGCAVIISHDRWFLDRVATHILAFEGDSHVEWFEGDFSSYLEDKKRRLGAEAVEPKRPTFKKFAR